jgi:hypothetical protein
MQKGEVKTPKSDFFLVQNLTNHYLKQKVSNFAKPHFPGEMQVFLPKRMF